MKRAVQQILSLEGQQAPVKYRHARQHLEDLSVVTICNYLSDLRQFMARCECSWREEQDERPFTPQAVAPLLYTRYRTYLQTTLWLKPFNVNRTLMSLKGHFVWVIKMQIIQHDSTTSTV